ncbi:MAG TPA: PHB depolymerase family esterase [Armatimonadota bacterium]
MVNSCLRGGRYLGLGLLLLLLACCVIGRALAATPAADDMRQPWSRVPGGFLRLWLRCGPFAGTGVADPLAVDYLQARGGEALIQPVAGLAHARPGRAATSWQYAVSPTDSIDPVWAFAASARVGEVTYAYATLFRATAGPALLALGSASDLQVRVNGAVVYTHHGARPLTPDADSVEISLHAGTNALLVKTVLGAGGGSFSLRVQELPRTLERTPGAPNQTASLYPYVMQADALHPHRLLVMSDYDEHPTSHPPVTVEVVAAGGAVVARQTTTRGGRVAFDSSAWPDGPYEVRSRLRPANALALTGHTLWYKGDALAALQGLLKRAPSATATDPAELVRQLLIDIVHDRLGPEPLTALMAHQQSYVYPVLMEAAELEQAAQGQRGPVHAGGFLRLAYRDEVDDAPQYCRVYLPADYDPAKRWPVVIQLHGKSTANPPYAQQSGVTRRFDPLADRYPAILVYPFGRGNTFYQGIGDRDVLRCLELVKGRLSVDDDRVYLMGYSMGGAGVWQVGARHPELFAALGPIFGGREFRVTMAAEELAQLSPRARFRTELQKSSFVNAESLLTTPVFANHGVSDATVPIAISRYGVTMLQRWGYAVRYWEHPGMGHEQPLGCEEALMQWLLAQRRSYPAMVRLRAGELRSAAAHWLRVEQRDDPTAFICAEAEVIGPNVIRLDSENALQVTLSPRAPLVDEAKPLQVLWNGVARSVKWVDGHVTVRAPGYLPPALGKTPERAGPAADLYQTPFAIVQGTCAPDPLMRAACAQAAAALLARWEQEQHCRPRFLLDSDVTEADCRAYSLLLVGGAQDNLIAKRFAGNLPYTLTPSDITVDGHRFAAQDAALQLVYPNPLQRARYLVVLAATSPAGMQHVGTTLRDVDFCISDGTSTPWLAAGYFDNAWRLRDAYIERGTATTPP